MSNSIEGLTAFNEKDGSVNAIIETPKASAIKYSYSPQSHLFRAKRTLPHGMVFPFNFGFVPGTLAEDGDPLDILIVDPEPFVCGCLVKARLLAVIEAEQTEEGKMVRNDRIVAMAIDEETPPEFLSVPLDEARIRQIVFFFASYNKINGKEFKHLRTGDPKDGEALIRKAAKRFERDVKTREPHLKAA
ncbi:MAG TPA: inorganic diphosphatase [Verrucomicrobiae bacterium]|jgi:inorganic pyrophosphatase|nr:inorganic diphosphatase [Verrucomicrobiae bacterium]